MAVFNFSLCVVLVLYQVCVAASDGVTPESKTDDPEAAEGVRCYCNTAQCVGTGYLCRSAAGGGCYSALPAPRRAATRHGCLHHLADTQQEALARCQNAPGSAAAAAAEPSLLLCCFRDLCNHEDSPVARARLNITAFESEASYPRAPGYSAEVWFKAATIAVPVCGAVILFLLVAVAVRLLRADALLHADRKLRGGYMSPLAQHEQDVKKVWLAPGGCLVAVERARLVPPPPATAPAPAAPAPLCDIQR